VEPREEFSDVLGSSGSRLDRPVARNVPSPPKMTEARNTKIYDVCQSWDGARGYSFENKFEPEFLRGLGKFNDGFVTAAMHLQGVGPGSVPPTTQAQLAVTADHVNRPSL